MLKFIFLLLISQSVFAQKLTMDERRKQILSIVDDEIKEVTRLAKQENFGNPDTLLRISELNLEKGRLFRENENEQFLAVPTAERQSINRAQFFKDLQLILIPLMIRQKLWLNVSLATKA